LSLPEWSPFRAIDSTGGRQVLSTNIRQGWKRMAVENTLAYCDTATIAAVRSFIVQDPEVFTKQKFYISNNCYRNDVNKTENFIREID
jgi:hypothetical protein